MSLYANARHRISELACTKGDLLLYTQVTFELQSGEMLWLKGGNGVGKTTLMRQIAGLLALDWGSVTWDGSVSSPDPYTHRLVTQHTKKPQRSGSQVA